MDTNEQNARDAAYHRWAAHETRDTREVDVIPASKGRAMARGAFLTGWRNAMEWAAKQGGPG